MCTSKIERPTLVSFLQCLVSSFDLFIWFKLSLSKTKSENNRKPYTFVSCLPCFRTWSNCSLRVAGAVTVTAVFGSVLVTSGVTAGLPSISKFCFVAKDIPATWSIFLGRCMLGCWTVGSRGKPTPRPTVGWTVVVGVVPAASVGVAALVCNANVVSITEALQSLLFPANSKN